MINSKDKINIEENVQPVVRSVFGINADSVKPILNNGKNNHVFKVSINNQNKILRLHNSTEQLAFYEKEKWCADVACKAGISTPEILTTGLHGDWSYSFQEYIESALTDSVQADKIWKILGEYAQKIHQIKAPDLGINYRDFIDNYADFFSSKTDHLFTQNLYNKMHRRLREIREWDFLPKLCHGNLHPSNVVVDVSGEVWLIDWETATGNIAPYADLAEIFTWNNGKHNIDLFCQGYGISSSELDSMMRDIQTLVLFRLLKVVQRKINRSHNDEWQQDSFISEMISLFSSVKNFEQDILFTKNL